MKKVVLLCSFLFLFLVSFTPAKKEHITIGAEFQSVMILTISSDPQVNFNFDSDEDIQNGIVKFNAVRLEVDATLPWDLFAYANTDYWIPGDVASSEDVSHLPAELLEIYSSSPNRCNPVGGNFNSFTGLKGLTNSGVVGGIPDANSTQFIAGMVGKEPNESYLPGTASMNSATNKFSLDYRIAPKHLSSLPNGKFSVGNNTASTDGDYYLEVVYVLVEDL